jgi:hypothetical protein
MRVETKIKEQLLLELYGKADAIYDLLHLRFELDGADDKSVVTALNALKTLLYQTAQKNRLA